MNKITTTYNLQPTTSLALQPTASQILQPTTSLPLPPTTYHLPPRIIGIDPGYDRCGFALLEKSGAKESLLYSGCYTTDPTLDFEERLCLVGEEFVRLVDAYKPNLCALEKVYFTSNQKTAMHVAEVRGMLLYLAKSNQLSVQQYNPNEIKVAIAGDGRADKKQVIFMVPRLVQIDKEIKYDDEYDAIAVALTASACVGTTTYNLPPTT